ncbi:MAG TPA: hypothetical protein VNJ02_10005 [Vicinamibacterales bacterium]|nr:hypothetical protein [Vicinamibacterales bacterium]
MRMLLLTILLALVMPLAVRAQSLFILQGERAAEGSVGWSVGPFSNGVETHAGASLDGRWDVGFGYNRYNVDLGGQDDSTFTEWTPFVRYFLFKEDDDGTPVSFAVQAQYFYDDFGADDGGWYVLGGGQIYKKLELRPELALYPFVGFSVAGESYSFGGASAERAVYLTRQFGVHGQVTFGDNTWLRVTAEEHSFRRETYRAARIALVRRF